MRKAVILVLAAATMAAFSFAEGKPNFSGEWTLDATKSDFGPMPPPASETRKVDQKDPDMTVVETQTGGAQGDTTITSKYSTDGKETTNQLMGADTKSTAKWDGDALVISTSADFQGMAITLIDKWTLSQDGKTLTTARHIDSPQGAFDMTMVMVKK